MGKLRPEDDVLGKDMIIAFALPTVFGKTLVVYFGGMYTYYPGEGYGYALSASIFFTVFNLCRFVWKYRNHSDE
ncbi:MAG: hypothetical protein AABZ31_07390 [Bdellovibrionota bacterium]